jgi:hypothetical protein
MLSLHVEGKSLDELREKAGAILGGMVAAVAMQEPNVKRSPGRPKKETAVAPETVESADPPSAVASAPAPEAIAPTLENVRKRLQAVAASEKDVNAGMAKAVKLLQDAVGKSKLKELVEADYQKVLDAAEKMLG